MTFLEQLKELCLKYDKQYGDYPESQFEGRALYEEAVESLDLDDDTMYGLRENYTNELRKFFPNGAKWI